MKASLRRWKNTSKNLRFLLIFSLPFEIFLDSLLHSEDEVWQMLYTANF